MLSLCQVIDNPLQDIPLAAVLRSPFFDFSDEELEAIKLLEESHYYRVLRYAVMLGRDDVARRLKEAYGRRIG